MRHGFALLLIFVAGTAYADAPKWDIARTTAPESVEELKSLQDTVKAMVAKVTPATVALSFELGSGSGVIVSEDGLILTAAHVVSRNPLMGRRPDDEPESRKVRVQLQDGKWVDALTKGRNRSADSAIVKITSPVPKDAKWPGASEGKWPYVELGNSADLKKGQWVVALGHPGGPKKDRRAPVRLGQLIRVTEKGSRITSDCTLVGGDSGGPLFDLAGKLIAIHTSIGMDLTQNLHVPVHTFKADWERLLRGDRVGESTDGYIGFVLNGDKDRKVKPIIEDVKAGTPASNAGLMADDVILELNGEKVTTSEDVDQIMTGMRSGQRTLIKVRRGDDVYEFEMTLGKRPK